MKFYFYIAFYNNGLIRTFNTKREPKPGNKHSGGKLLKVKKFKVKI